MIIPTIISATAVGTLVTRNRAIKIGITNAKSTTKNKDSCSNSIPPSIITKIIQKNTPFSHRKRYILLNLEIISFYKLSWANCIIFNSLYGDFRAISLYRISLQKLSNSNTDTNSIINVSITF